jgi:dinuclear metal center YbgI/SA1388 family protein
MTVTRQQLLAVANEIMSPHLFSDYCPNGLQVEGRDTVSVLVSGVTATQALIDEAIALNADALLVHHGYFWKGEDACLVGMKQRRIKALLEHGINLLAYHLPLDAHAKLGNNAQLAKLLEIEITGGLQLGMERSVGNIGRFRQSMIIRDLLRLIELKLGREPLWIDGGCGESVIKVAWCTGAAQGYIDDAIAQGADVFISGEISEPTVHIAREMGIHYIAAGHHATERYGVKALGEELASRLGLAHHFVDIDNPV